MSCMHCETCSNLVDTDEDLEGTWTDFGYICTRCTEEAENGTAADVAKSEMVNP